MAPSQRPTGKVAHILLLPPEEAAHQLSDEGAARALDDGDLAPGHDCCAVCAAPSDPPLVCSLCHSVHYCCPQHLVDDAHRHAAVCPVLQYIRRAEARREAQQQDAAVLDTVTDDTGRPGQAALRGTEVFRAPSCGQDGWAYVAPERFLAVYPKDRRPRGGDEASADEPECKRRRVAPDDDPSVRAQTCLGAKKAGDVQPSDAAGPSTPVPPARAADSYPDTDSDAQLDLAAELADRTALLTYAYTAALALRRVVSSGVSTGSGNGAAVGPTRRQRALRVVVLGAAGDAELADLESWKVVADTLHRDVHFCFVGPEVPDELAGKHRRLGNVDMVFKQHTFDKAVAADAEGGQRAGGGRAGAEGAGAGSAGPQDVYLAFNPGFTCPDYEWADTLEAISSARRPATAGDKAAGGGDGPDGVRLQLIVATNTRSEADMDADMLREHGWRAAAQPALNPYTSLKVLQNGALANDLYRKNAWLTFYSPPGPDRARGRQGRHGRGNGRRTKGAVGGAAKALYDVMVAPLTRLFQKR